MHNGSLKGDVKEKRAEIIFEEITAKIEEKKSLFSSFYEASNSLKQKNT